MLSRTNKLQGGDTLEFNESLKDYFKDLKVTIAIYPDNYRKEFLTITSFYEFVKEQVEFWNTCTNGLTSQIRSAFINIVNLIESAGRANDPNQARNNIKSAISDANRNNFPTVYSTTPIAKFIKERYLENHAEADAACNYFCRYTTDSSNFSSKEYFKGIISSVLFDGVNDQNRSESEKHALNDLRNRFSEEHDKLYEEYLNRLQTLDQNYSYRTNELNIAFNKLQVSNDEWKKEWEEQLKTFHNAGVTKLTDLEQTYNDKLRLEGPATYWKEMAKTYTDKGNHWRKWAVGTTSIFIIYLTLLLYNLPESWAKSTGITFSSIKSTIIFTLIASMGVYLINLFVKLTTSSYHLATDANERYQLTYVYLSLLHEKGVSDSERSIVLQSIFSRADTGLLKGDSGPTLPDSLLSQVFKSIKQ